MPNFFCIDVETATADSSTICQVGIVQWVHGNRHFEKSWYIDPKCAFDPWNSSIHGITEGDVRGAPVFSEVFGEFRELLVGSIVLHHGHFDYTAFRRCYDKFNLSPIDCSWLDNTKIVRRTWSEVAKSGYALNKLADRFSVELDHHDALSDARAAGEIFLLAIQDSGKSPEDWLVEVQTRPSSSNNPQDFRRDGDPTAPFFGEKIVFTGALEVSRSTAADVAQKLGFDVQNGVNKSTTFLCVGIQDAQVLAGYDKSSKQRKAETLIEKGHEISILSEKDFWEIAKVHSTGEVE